MNYLHWEFDAKSGNAVEVTLDKQANVRLMDSHNFGLYRRGARHSYRGGLAEQSPIRLGIPKAGHWHVVVDLGGYAGHVSAGARLVH